MMNCNYTEDLAPQLNAENTFNQCFEDLNVTYFIIDELLEIIISDVPEFWVWFGN